MNKVARNVRRKSISSISKILFVAMVFALIPVSAFSAPKVTAGSTCKTYKLKVSNMNKIYTCIKSGKKLVWSESTQTAKASAKPTETAAKPTETAAKPNEKKGISYLVPLKPAATDPITWENLESRVGEISAIAWQSAQDTMEANSGSSRVGSVKVIYAPLTANTHYSGFENHLRTGIKLWNRFILPPQATFLVYSYDEIPWAKKEIKRILTDSGMDENQAIQRGNNLAVAPYGGPECGGANAGMMSDKQAIGVFGLCPRNEGSDPYYLGPLQIHEFTHQLQGSQFIGTKLNSQQILPCWISEGLAHAGGLSGGTTTLNDYLEVRKRQASHPVLNVAGGHSSTQLQASTIDYEFMKKFYAESSPPGCFALPSYSLGYSAGFLTTEALASIGGIESTLLLFSRAAGGETFEEAFKNIYGLSWSKASDILAKVVSKQFSLFT